MSTNNKYTLKQLITMFARGIKLFNTLPKPVMFSTALSSGLTAIVPFINIYFAAQVLNELVGTRNTERLLLLVILTIGLNLLIMLIQRAVLRWDAYCGNKSWDAVYKILSDKSVSMDYCDYEDAAIQDKYSQIRHDQWFTGFGLLKLTDLVKEAIQGMIRIIMAIALTVTLFSLQVPHNSTYAWMNSPWVIIVILLVFAGPILLTPYLNLLGGKVWVKDIEAGKKANRFFSHYFFDMHKDSIAAKDIRIYDQKKIIKAQLVKSPDWNWRNNQTWGKFMKDEAKYVAVGVAVTHICNGVLFLFVALKALAGAFGVGSLLMYVGALTQFGMGLSAVMTVLGQIKNNNPFLARWFEFLDIPNKMQQGNMHVEDSSKYEIEFRNVSFKYPKSDEYVLKSISLRFNIGDRHAIVGENGSGKTTFIKLLCRLYDPNEGEILLNGVNIKEYNYNDYMSIFGIVFQDFGLLPFTLGQNVATCVNYDEERVRSSLDSAGFNERLSGMKNRLDTYLYKEFEEEGVEVSGGEAQKIALARAIYRNAPFIILDEPTAALDPIAEYEVYSKMNEIAGEKTAVFVSHRLSSCRFCDDIIVFHGGEVIQRGNHDNLLENENGKYFELWNAQAQYYQV